MHEMAGIIPADAGNTTGPPHGRPWSEDHPRGCGEHDVLSHAFDPGAGSSPRMRGTQRESRRPVPVAGIIPADAGNTDGEHVLVAYGQDHPRGCGEHTPDLS